MPMVEKEKIKEYKRQYYLKNKEINATTAEEYHNAENVGGSRYATMAKKSEHVSNIKEVIYANMIK